MISGRVLSVGDTSTRGMSCWVSKVFCAGDKKVYSCGMYLMLGSGKGKFKGQEGANKKSLTESRVKTRRRCPHSRLPSPLSPLLLTGPEDPTIGEKG